VHAQNTKKSKSEKRQERQAVKAEENIVRCAPVRGRTPGQNRYLAALKSSVMTIAIGPAGTGKTFMAASYAAEMFIAGKIKQIILVRPAVAAGGEEHGFLPGDLKKKLAPWTAPVMAVLRQKMGNGKVDALIAADLIRVEPFTYMRGLTFSDAFVLLDEAQNATTEQMKLFTTRIGENCKVVIDGDIEQATDLGPVTSGLHAVISIAHSQRLEDVEVVTLTVRDIVRSGMTKAWVQGWHAHEKGTLPPMAFMGGSAVQPGAGLQ
jgi:phosphate starvation-inducible PhoH-like protein